MCHYDPKKYIDEYIYSADSPTLMNLPIYQYIFLKVYLSNVTLYVLIKVRLLHVVDFALQIRIFALC